MNTDRKDIVVNESKERNACFDIARGVAIILVMYAHSCGMPFKITQYIIAFYMPLFFIIGGYFWHNNTGFFDYLKKKSKRILVPYFGASFFLYLLFMLFGWMNENRVLSFLGVFYSTYAFYAPVSTENNLLLFTIDNAPMWFLTTYFCALILMYFYEKITEGSKIKKIAAASVLLFAAYALSFLPIYLPWGCDIAFLGAFFMALGKEARYINRKLPHPWLAGVFLFVIYCIIVNINSNPNMSTRAYGDFMYFDIILFAFTGIVGSDFLIRASRLLENNLIGRILALVGKNSMTLLMFHLVVFRMLNSVYDISGLFGGKYLRALGTVRIAVACIIILLIKRALVLGLNYGREKIGK